MYLHVGIFRSRLQSSRERGYRAPRYADQLESRNAELLARFLLRPAPNFFPFQPPASTQRRPTPTNPHSFPKHLCLRAGNMSSIRNAVQRRNHKERAQPEERAKWGLLEKRKVNLYYFFQKRTELTIYRTTNCAPPITAKRRSVSKSSRKKPASATLTNSPLA